MRNKLDEFIRSVKQNEQNPKVEWVKLYLLDTGVIYSMVTFKCEIVEEKLLKNAD